MPENSIFILHTGEKILGDGNNVVFPLVVTDNDVFIYEDYKYTYHQNINGWHAEAINKNKTRYRGLVKEIADKPLVSLCETFKDCAQLIEGPDIPDTVNDMRSTYSGCKSLRAVIIGRNIVDISNCFENCSSLEFGPKLPQDLQNANFAFAHCTALRIAPDFSASKDVMFMESTFEDCSSLVQSPNISKCSKLKTIKNAFKDCVNLKKVSLIPQNIEDAHGTFDNCTSLIRKPPMPPHAIA